MNFKKYKDKKGFTLIEILIAMSIISLIAMAFFTTLNATIKGNISNERNIKSMNLAQSEIENLIQQVKHSEKIEVISNINSNHIPISIKIGDEVEAHKKINDKDNNIYYEKIKIDKEIIKDGMVQNYLYTIKVMVSYSKENFDLNKGKEITTQVFSEKNF